MAPSKSKSPVARTSPPPASSLAAQNHNGQNHNNSVERLIDIGKIYAIVKKNWMVMRSDKIRLVMLMMFPLIMILIYGYTAGALPKYIPAGVVDYDNSPYSNQVVEGLYANQLFIINHRLGSQDEGKKMIEQGDIKILFVIPQGFEDDINAGRTASISVILDQADPTAQITRATTANYINALSQQITASRLASSAAKAQMSSQYLALAQSSLQRVSSSIDADKMSAMDASFKDAQRISSMTDSGLSSSIQGLQNSIGNVIDENELAATGHNSDPRAVLASLAAGDAQLTALTQISAYQGLRGSNALLMRDTANIYSNANAIEGSSVADKAVISATYSLLGSAKDAISDSASETQKATQTSLSMNEIMPYGSGRPGLDFLIPGILALIVFQGAVMGMGRAIAGERRDGSLTRVFLTPTSNVTIIVGTLLFYVVFETIRSSIIVFIAMLLFGVSIKGSMVDIFILITIYAVGSTGLGMILSVLSRSQEQFMAIGMLFTLPSMFLSGVFLPIETMPSVFQGIANALPITYASDGLRGIMIKGFTLGQVTPDLMFLGLFALATIALSVALFKRELI